MLAIICFELLGVSRVTPAEIIGYVTLLSGALALAFSIVYASMILAFIGLGLIFWGALLFYVKPERHVKATLLDSSTYALLENVNSILEESGCKGKAIYLPPKYSEDLKTTKVFIPHENSLLLPEKTKEKTILKNSKGIFLTPPGLSLTTTFENELDTDFLKLDMERLQQYLPKVILDSFNLAEDFQIEVKNDTVSVTIRDAVFQNIYKTAGTLRKIRNSIGCPLCSAIACAITKASGNALIIEIEDHSNKKRIISTHYRILKEG